MPASFATLFLAALLGAALAGILPVTLAALYLLTSLATFVAYAFDKSAARNKRRRIPENTLHAFGLAGGWPGALIAQSALRHKSKKMPFRAILWLTAMLHCAAFSAWLYLFPPAILATR
ncbi:MAG TPA: DUF1294 domain-containing protein [Noviherbaspirillum sp.]